MLLQWHITDRCNCRCSHCYQPHDNPVLEPDRRAWETVVAQFKALLIALGSKEQPARGHITVTGGEPFVCDDFFALLQLLVENKRYFSFAILTNGTLITRDVADKLRAMQPRFVQVSVEGSKSVHDSIRGAGNYDKTVQGIGHLVNSGIRTFISFTAQRDNYREFTAVAALGRKLKVAKVWSDRHIPLGLGQDLRGKMLTPAETREFFSLMLAARRRAQKQWFGKTEIGMDRGLQFLVGGGQPYHCTAGYSLLTLMPNGDVYPCRRMPLPVGNVTELSLAEIYRSHPLLQRLRATTVSSGCETCFHQPACRGGLKCLAAAVYGDPWRADPGCWYANHG